MNLDKEGLASLLERVRYEANLVRCERDGFKELTPRSKIMDEAADAIASLQQANAALTNERESLIATKREQIDGLTRRAKTAEASLANARDRIAALEVGLADCATALDHAGYPKAADLARALINKDSGNG